MMAMSNRTFFIIIGVTVLLVGFGVGFLGGFYAKKEDTSAHDLLNSLTRDADDSISQKLLDQINAENIRNYLRYEHVTYIRHHPYTLLLKSQILLLCYLLHAPNFIRFDPSVFWVYPVTEIIWARCRENCGCGTADK